MTSMPKIIELSVELEIQRVSCPGVWLCQDGRVSLTVFALGTSYQTCLLPPMFPLLFKDVFYFRKRFQETCALNNMCCLLKDETIFCELVQWCDDCNSGECTILAQYLGALTDVLFPPNMCSTEGVDLLMRRAKDFPGILSPKIEIATKVRIDEVWNTGCHISQLKTTPCRCAADTDALRQRQVCHTPQYHRPAEPDRYQRSVCHSPDFHKLLLRKCSVAGRRPRSRSRSRSGGSRSCVSLRDIDPNDCKCPNPLSNVCRRAPARPRSATRPCPAYNVYTANTGHNVWSRHEIDMDDDLCDTPSRSAFPPPSTSPRPSRTARCDRTTEYQHGERRELISQNSSENREASASHARSSLRDRSPPECSRALRERNLVVEECMSQLHARSSTMRVRSSKVQDRSSARERSPASPDRASLRQERNLVIKERGPIIQERESIIQERGPIIQERGPIIQERGPIIQERGPIIQERVSIIQERCSSPRGHNGRIRERKLTQKSSPRRGRSTSKSRARLYRVYNVDTGKLPVWPRGLTRDDYDDIRLGLEKRHSPADERGYQKVQIESRYIDDSSDRRKPDTYSRTDKPKLKPCVCEICKRYHELFHNDTEYAKC